MRFNNIQYLEKEQVTVSIQNLNAAAVIIDGQVVFAISQNLLTTYSANTTGQIAFPSSLGVAAQTAADIFANITNPIALVVGIAKVNPTTGNQPALGASQQASLPLLGVGEAVCYGFTDAIIQRRTRASSTATWATVASFAAGDMLVPESVNGYLTWSQTLAIGANQPMFAAAESQNSLTTFASSANTNAVTATVETARIKVRVMQL